MEGSAIGKHLVKSPGRLFLLRRRIPVGRSGGGWAAPRVRPPAQRERVPPREEVEKATIEPPEEPPRLC